MLNLPELERLELQIMDALSVVILIIMLWAALSGLKHKDPLEVKVGACGLFWVIFISLYSWLIKAGNEFADLLFAPLLVFGFLTAWFAMQYSRQKRNK